MRRRIGVALLGGLVMLETFRVRIILSAERITGETWWRRSRTIGWADVAEVSYSQLGGWFVFRAMDGQKLRVPLLLTGIRSVRYAVERHLRPEQFARAVK